MSEPVYSAYQDTAGTDVGPTGQMPSPGMPATPDVAGSVGPPVGSEEPSAGRFEDAKAGFDTAAAAYGEALTRAYTSPGRRVDVMTVPDGVTNS